MIRLFQTFGLQVMMLKQSYKQWSYKLESVINQCFKKCRVRVRKKLYNQEIRSLIKNRKYVKKHLDREPYSRYFQAALKKLDRIIDKKVTNDFIIQS